MGISWKEQYNGLLEYVANHPAIQIKPTSICMSGDERIEFYRQFDSILNAFVMDNFADDIAYAEVLSSKWKNQCDVISNQLGIEKFTLDLHVGPFLKNPVDALTRLLFTPLMNVFQSHSTIEEFESNSLKNTREEIDFCCKYGYYRFITLKIIELFDADEIYTFRSPDSNNGVDALDGVATSHRYEPAPEPELTKELYFEIASSCGFLTSRMVLHSRKYNRFVALRQEPYEPHWIAKLRTSNQTWISMSGIEYEYGQKDLWPNMLVYVADDIRDLTVCADRYWFALPNFIIEIEQDKDWVTNGRLSSIKRHAIITQPKCGTIVISKESFDEEAFIANSIPQALSSDFKVKHLIPTIIYKHEEPEEVLVEEKVDSETVDAENVEATNQVAEDTEKIEIETEEPAVVAEEPVEYEPELVIKAITATNDDISSMSAILDDFFVQIPALPMASWDE